MKENSCCFTGHRFLEPGDDEVTIKQMLAEHIEILTESGVTRFYCGGALGFDTIAAMCVLELKKSRSDISLILALPCRSQDKYFNKYQKRLYEHIMENADRVIYTGYTYTPSCMHERNRYMVDNCAHCICYLRKQTGGTRYTVHYAHDCGLKVIYI